MSPFWLGVFSVYKVGLASGALSDYCGCVMFAYEYLKKEKDELL